MNRKIVFSDLHLAGGGKNDQFLEDDFARCLQSIIEDGFSGRTDIYYAGDIYDLREDSYGDCVSAHLPVAMAIESARHDDRYVHGNHDRSVPTPSFVDLPGGIRILHGHQFDKANDGTFQFIGDTVASLVGWFEKRGWGHFTVTGWLRRIRNREVRRGARRYLRENKDLAGLILGHTHRGEFLQRNGRFIVNTGCWVLPREMCYAEIIYYPTYTHIALKRWTIQGSELLGMSNIMT